MSRKHKAWAVSAVIALIWMGAHFWYGWEAEKFEASSHGQERQMDEYRIAWARDTTENLQSEFWQIAWQMALLAGILAPIVVSYEKDVEDVKNILRDINYQLEGLYSKIGATPPEPEEPING